MLANVEIQKCELSFFQRLTGMEKSAVMFNDALARGGTKVGASRHNRRAWLDVDGFSQNAAVRTQTIVVCSTLSRPNA